MIRTLAVMLLGIGLLSCASPPKSPSLYQQLGETAGIEQVVADLLRRVQADPRIEHHFIGVDLDQLQQRLVEQLCVETGGPCEYRGQSMQAAHDGLDIQDDEFTALVEDLVAALQAAGVPQPAQDRLLARLAAMQPDIVGR